MKPAAASAKNGAMLSKMGLRGIKWVQLAFPDVNIARAREH
jgi:hypothetical protein